MAAASGSAERTGRAGALSGLRVIELGGGVSAPFCARLFADYGADVIKLESPGRGDIARSWGPFPEDRPDPEQSGTFFFLNGGKRSVQIDLATKAGRDVLSALLAEADLLIGNESPEAMRAWGLDAEGLAKINPDLVAVSITPFGSTGPYAGWKGDDLNAYHLTASGSRYCGRPGEPPLAQGTFSSSFFAAFVGAAWGLASLLGRDRVGGGQCLDVACSEVVAALFVGAQNIGAYAQDGRYEKRSGKGMSLAAPATILPCADGHVWMIALETAQWHGLRRAMGDPVWARVELFDDMFERGRNADILYPLIEEWTKARSKQEVMERCQAEGCPVTAVYTTEDLAKSPHLRERGAIETVDHPRLGTRLCMAPPVRLSEGLPAHRSAAPLLGESDDALAAWRSARFARGGATEPSLWKCGKSRWSGTLSRRPSAARKARHRAAGGGDRLPLEGLRVANFGWAWAGPVAGQVLGLLGAEVYKIETRSRIDINRTLPPFAGGIPGPDRSLQNHAGWAGNGSIQLDLKKSEARALAVDLVARCDLAIENFGPGVMEKLGLGYECFREARPDIVLVSMPGAGTTGPLSHLRTYGNSLGGISGIDAITGYTGEGPCPMENAFADPYSGVAAAWAALLALSERERTGRGQWVDCSQQETLMQMAGPQFMDYVFNERIAHPIGNRHPLGAAAPHGVFPCRGEDRWISIAVSTDEEWRGLVAAMDGPEWADDFDDFEGRLAGIEEIHARLADWTAGFEDRELAERLQAQGVAAAPVLDVADLLSDPQYKARKTFIEVIHPLGFRETIYGAYVKTSRSRIDVRPGPTIGQDNDYVFGDVLGLSEAEIRRLVDDGVIY